MLCTRCGKNPAVLIMNDEKNPDIVKQALCAQCLNEMSAGSMDSMAQMLGMNPEEIQKSLSETMEAIGASGDMPANIGFMINLPTDGENSEMQNPQHFFEKFMGGMFGRSANDESEEKPERKNSKQKNTKKSRKFLEMYGTNITEKAKEGEIDRVIGRESEIARIIQVLNRRSKNNPVLLGEPGVGKTAIAEGLAVRIIEKKVPAKLLGYEIYLLDFAALVAGTQFRGQFESRLKNLIEETKKEGNIILVIDEIHNIVGAGDAEGAMNAANILKPALARGEIQVIGATTLNEYRKKIEKDSALERRFQPVLVEEPSSSEAIDILRGIKGYYEDYHKVSIDDEVIKSAVLLSQRYIHDRFLPDKAIDLIDEASSKVNLSNTVLVEISELERELAKINADRENADADDYQAIANFKIAECKVTDRLNELKSTFINSPVTVDDVANVTQMWTKIPVQKLTEVDSKKLLSLEDDLHKRVIGQHDAVSAVARAVRRKRAGFDMKKRPVSFIFVGPTGVGKTELVKSLAECMFGSEEALIRIDMSEYMEKHSVSKLIGSPPGYVGYDEAGQITEKVRRNPYSIILLDEIEKAHEDVFNIFLQVLDDGRITDSQGRIINFENTVIIMTSNAGSSASSSAAIGFGGTETETRYEKTLNAIFRPEFLNRVDEIIEFKPLSEDELLQIAGLMTTEIKLGLAEKNISLDIDDSAKSLIVQKGNVKKFGARPLRRIIMKEIEDKIADMIISGELVQGNALFVTAENDEFIFNIKI